MTKVEEPKAKFFDKGRKDFLWIEHCDGSNWYYRGREDFLQLELDTGQKYYYDKGDTHGFSSLCN